MFVHVRIESSWQDPEHNQFDFEPRNFLMQRHNHGRTSTSPQNAAATAARHRYICRPPYSVDHTCALHSLLHALISSSKMVHTNKLSPTFKGSGRTMGWSDTCTSDSCIFERIDDGECSGVDRCRATITFSPCIYPTFHITPVVLIKNALYMFMCVPQKKAEPVPNLKAATRLLCHIFSAATDIPEFQRQLATPNVPKFSLAVLALADKHHDRELQVSYFPIFFPLKLYKMSDSGDS